MTYVVSSDVLLQKCYAPLYNLWSGYTVKLLFPNLVLRSHQRYCCFNCSRQLQSTYTTMVAAEGGGGLEAVAPPKPEKLLICKLR